jgi:hypothetical protein
MAELPVAVWPRREISEALSTFGINDTPRRVHGTAPEHLLASTFFHSNSLHPFFLFLEDDFSIEIVTQFDFTFCFISSLGIEYRPFTTLELESPSSLHIRNGPFTICLSLAFSDSRIAQLCSTVESCSYSSCTWPSSHCQV